MVDESCLELVVRGVEFVPVEPERLEGSAVAAPVMPTPVPGLVVDGFLADLDHVGVAQPLIAACCGFGDTTQRRTIR